jgi:hypothetical protein
VTAIDAATLTALANGIIPADDVDTAFFKQLRMDVSALYLRDRAVWERIGLPWPVNRHRRASGLRPATGRVTKGAERGAVGGTILADRRSPKGRSKSRTSNADRRKADSFISP